MKRLFEALTLLLLLASCYSDESLYQSGDKSKMISLAAEISQVSVTRVDDGGFCDNDVMGVYIVDYAGENPGRLQAIGNRADNVKYTYDEPNGRWNPEREIYYKDDKTPVDVYGYYPFAIIDDVNAYSFSVQRNQSKDGGGGELSGYEASDFLWGKAMKAMPAESQIMITMHHKMSCVRVELIEGDGFAEGEWRALEKNIVLKNLKRDCSIDLFTGEVTATGSVAGSGTVPYKKDNFFRAIVVPQSVPAGTELFAISVGTVPYSFAKSEAFEYESGKMHKFTLKVNKKGANEEYEFVLAGEAITVWENDDVSHNVSAREYVVVNSTARGLRNAIVTAGYDYKTLQNLKVTGEIADDDFYFMRDSMPVLECLNLADVLIERKDVYIGKIENVDFPEYYENARAIPHAAFQNKSSLSRIVFPKELDVIDGNAFANSSLTGSLSIPEGVVAIAWDAFCNCNKLNGKLTLPSTLRIIQFNAFEGCSNLIGELRLPESLEYIGGRAFNSCRGFSGQLILPEKLQVIENNTFEGCRFSGDLKIPANCVTIHPYAFYGVPFKGRLILHEGLEHIGYNAFGYCGLTGSLVLPTTLKTIGEWAFRYNNLRGELVLPEGLTQLGRHSFGGNSELTGVVVIPKKIDALLPGLFNGCSGIEGIVLHKDVRSIGNGALEGCWMLNTIVSDAEVPPVVGTGAFNGVPKDNFTVEVPESAVADYVAASGWSDFHRIAAHYELVCRPAFAVAINKETRRTLVLNAEGDWEVTSIPEWCTLSSTSGSKKTELILTIKELAPGSPSRSGEIVFKLKEKDYTHTCTVSQYDYQYKEDEVITLQKATKGNNGGIDLVFIGDGYDGKDISEGLYLQDVQIQVENFFAIHPYKAYRDYFNVYTAIAVSNQSGTGTLNSIKYNKFETTYTSSTGLKCNEDAVFKYVLDMNTTVTAENLKEALIVLMPNASEYGGITYLWEDGTAMAICPKSDMDYPYDTRGILQHEAGGHGFGKLGDEYIYHNAFIDACGCMCCPQPHVLIFEMCKSLGWYDNLSLTGKLHKVPWSHLIFDERYSDIVDIYEGGYMHARGVYRSEYTSCMNNNIAYFSTISRESIVKRIKEYAGEEYSFEEFVSNDSRETGLTTKGGTDYVPGISLPVHHSAPVVYSGSPLSNLKKQ